MRDKLQPIRGERQQGESDSAVIACNDWLRMGTGRSLPALVQKYTEAHQKAPPTQSINTVKGWSKKFNWSDRATQFDAEYEAIKTAQRQAEMDYGAALDFERVARLKRLADFLEAQIYERGISLARGEETHINVWLHDAKQIGGGDNAERVDIERFNSALVSEYRSTLDDIAKETGGRKQKHEHTGSDGGPIQSQQTNVTIQAETPHDAANILRQLAELGAIPPATGAAGDDPPPE